MVQLAIYPFGSRLYATVGLWQAFESNIFPLARSNQQLMGDLVDWLETLQISPADLELIISSDFELSKELANQWSIPLDVIEQRSTSECNPLAIVTGTPHINRGCVCDSFIFKYLANVEEHKRNLELNQGKFILAYLDEEIQIGAIDQGQVIDVSSSFDEGPFAWEQAGALPFDALLDLCQKTGTKEATLEKINSASGLKGYLGYTELNEFFDNSSDLLNQEMVQALAYQISKEIGAAAAVLAGQVDAIIYSGQFAAHQGLLDSLQSRVGFLGGFSVYPGNQILVALHARAKRLQEGE